VSYLAVRNSLKGSPLVPPGKPLPNAADTAAAAGSLLSTGAPWSRKLEFSTGGSGRTTAAVAAGRVITAVAGSAVERAGGGRAVVTAAAAGGGGRVVAAAAAADVGRLLVPATGRGFSGAEGRPGWALAGGGGGRAANGDAAWGGEGRGGRPLLAAAAGDSSGRGPATAGGGGGGSGCSASRSAEGRPPKIPLSGRRKLIAGSLRKEPPGCEEGRCCDAGGKTCPCRSSKNAGGDCSSRSCCSAFFDLAFLFLFFFLSPSVSPLLWLKFSRTGLDECCCCGRCTTGAASGLGLLLLLGALKGSNDGCAEGQKEEGRNPSNWETSAALRGGGPSKAANRRSAKLRGGRGAKRWGRAGTAAGRAGTTGRAGPAAKSPLGRGASPSLLESPSGSELARREGGPKKPDRAYRPPTCRTDSSCFLSI
jgi:hypothetical protein